ncbi:MAG: sigma-54 dependent transcriptional regulator [Desulfuromonadaceae bacterium]|nr:sigma-54 dependent transcriptional regulator [Desulfuromonas sp.]MDY0184750.1 sigma-54 dependent transcriptional regulator [Desulfuromonadaceae bacterium]
MAFASSSTPRYNSPHLLIVDDEASMREVLEIMFHAEGYSVDVAADGAQALEKLQHQAYDLILTDMRMPNIDGLELLERIRNLHTETLVIMMTAYSTTAQAVEAMKLGAYDYIVKPFNNEDIRLTIKKALEFSSLKHENKHLRSELDRRNSFERLTGKSAAMQQLYTLIEKVAPTTASVLISGESGTGKELVAKAIHRNSLRAERSFVAINCGAVPENLLENELFGHEKGAFTGADQRKEGLFDQADGGTLFLDEIAELPLQMQVKLLRALQEKEIRPIGGNKDHQVDVRIIAATNRDLKALIEAQEFRQDLFYRLNVVHLQVPPLRHRREDIPLLIEAICRVLAPQRILRISPPMMRALLDYAWPGNVRELENVLERSIILSEDDMLEFASLPASITESENRPAPTALLPEEGMDIEAYLREVETQLLSQALERSNGIKKKAARLLHLSFRSLRYRLEKLGL